ncbi:hypothetical protein PanWU01x14_028740, partial [Parasponia andersonii]
ERLDLREFHNRLALWDAPLIGSLGPHLHVRPQYSSSSSSSPLGIPKFVMPSSSSINFKASEHI